MSRAANAYADRSGFDDDLEIGTAGVGATRLRGLNDDRQQARTHFAASAGQAPIATTSGTPHEPRAAARSPPRPRRAPAPSRARATTLRRAST